MVEKGYFEKRDKALQEAQGAVDPRLDSRTGDDRPPLESDPAVPQQVDGPDLMHQEEHAAAVAKLRESQQVERKGMFSPGDHSLGDDEARGGNDAGQADETLETDPASPASAPTDARQGDVGGATEKATAAPGERRTRSK